MPIKVMYDTGLDRFEIDSVIEAMVAFKRLFPQRRITIYGSKPWLATGDYSGPDWYIQAARKVHTTGNRVQLDAHSVLHLLEDEPWQTQCPHVDVFFTSYDLTTQGMNFCFGATEGRCTVQSVYRYRGLNPEDRKLAIKTVVWHELGHVFGLAGDPNRTNTQYLFGGHCTNYGCAMRQGMNLTEWVTIVRELKTAGRIYCPQCMQDMRAARI